MSVRHRTSVRQMYYGMHSHTHGLGGAEILGGAEAVVELVEAAEGKNQRFS